MVRDDSRENGPFTDRSRRTVLKAFGAAGAASGLSGLAGAQQGGQQQPTTIILGGQVEYWYGLVPERIEGKQNPTLTLQPGKRYRVVWINLDGAPHDFTIQDSNGSRIASTKTMSNQGKTLSLTFTAKKNMAQYICTVHPNTMKGNIKIQQGGGAGG